MTALRVVFVLSPYQNAFFTEIADALGGALRAHGVDSVITREAADHPVAAGDVFVLLPPHEYVALEGDGFLVDEAVAARTIGISAEQPSEVHFPHNVEIARQLGATLDFSPMSVAAYRERGVDAKHLAFGYVPEWDRVGGRLDAQDARSTAVLYLGNNRERRLGILAGAADVLVGYQTRLVVSDISEPNRLDDPWFFVGERKRDLLSGTEMLVNIHQSEQPYFEWLRFSEAAHCGTTVLTEVSTATDPFVDGEHFASFSSGELGVRLEELMNDPEQRLTLARSAYARLVEAPLAESIRSLVEVARRIIEAVPAPAALPARTRTEPIGRDRTDVEPADSWRPSRRPLARIRAQRAASWELVAPSGTILHADPERFVAEDDSMSFVNVMASGRDAAGAPMLEGLWPWQPWRLHHGQHLGRVLLVRPELHRAARRWLPNPEFDAVPQLRIQLFAAVHGIAGDHVAAPWAQLAAPIDPTHAVSDELAVACRAVLARR